MILDDAAVTGRVDVSNMLSLMERAPERLVVPEEARSTCRLDVGKPLNVVLAGLGGSGIVGEILADYCRNSVESPVNVSRLVKIPRFVDKNTFFVAISYSGETVETLQMFEQARAAGAKLAVVCSGGKLLAEAQRLGVPYVKVTSGLLPRVALPELVAAVTHVLGEAKIIERSHQLLELGRSSMKEILSKANSKVPLKDNAAKQFATALLGRLPVLLGSEEYLSVLRRFKNELNENSKVPAFFYIFPEAFHDDIEGLKDLATLSQPQPVILRSQSETVGDQRVNEKLGELFSQLKFPSPLFFEGVGSGLFEWLLSAITFGDFVSFYLAILKGVDPSGMALISAFRALRGQR